MRFYEFKNKVEEEQIVEIVPALAAIGRVGAKMGSAVAKGAANVAGKAANLGAKAGKAVGNKIAKGTANIIQKAQDKVAGAVLKKGAQLTMPSQGGKEQEFDIQDVKGDQVTVANPKPKPGEPTAFVYTKKELEPMVKAKADAVSGKGTVPGGDKGQTI